MKCEAHRHLHRKEPHRRARPLLKTQAGSLKPPGQMSLLLKIWFTRDRKSTSRRWRSCHGNRDVPGRRHSRGWSGRPVPELQLLDRTYQHCLKVYHVISGGGLHHRALNTGKGARIHGLLVYCLVCRNWHACSRLEHGQCYDHAESENVNFNRCRWAFAHVDPPGTSAWHDQQEVTHPCRFNINTYRQSQAVLYGPIHVVTPVGADAMIAARLQYYMLSSAGAHAWCSRISSDAAALLNLEVWPSRGFSFSRFGVQAA